MKLSEHLPVRLNCTRCGSWREVTPRVETESGDVGHTVSAWLEFAVEPPCPGYVVCEADWSALPHTDDEGCAGPDSLPSCPFDAHDDYSHTPEMIAIYAVLADRKHYGRAGA